jgi:O-antigen/teichoic acid export membrane protein
VVAWTIPLVVVTSGLRGVLEGFQEFRLLNLIRIPAGILLFVAPAVTSMFSPRLDVAIAGLAAARLAILLAHVQPCRSRVELKVRWIQREWLGPMVRFGGWLTVSSIVGPVIVYMDRFILGIVQSAEAVAYYAAPFEVVSRLLIVPAALTVAMFPVMANLHRTGSLAANSMRREALLMLACILVPVCLVGVLLAEPALRLWLGQDFARNSSVALQFLLPGFALNAIAQIPVLSLQSSGRARPVALLHLLQFPLYAALLYSLASSHGVAGAAIASSVRAAFDCVALFAMLRIIESRDTSDASTTR